MVSVAEKEPKEDKVREVETLRKMIESSSTAILADYRGLNVKSLYALRGRLRDNNTQFRVVKNTLFKRAAAGTMAEKLFDYLEGPTAVAATSGDPVAAAKALFNYIREARSPMTIKAAIVDGQLMDADGVKMLSTLPGKQQLVAMVIGGLQSPITGLVGTLNQLTVQMVMTLMAIAEKQSQSA